MGRCTIGISSTVVGSFSKLELGAAAIHCSHNDHVSTRVGSGKVGYKCYLHVHMQHVYNKQLDEYKIIIYICNITLAREFRMKSFLIVTMLQVILRCTSSLNL